MKKILITGALCSLISSPIAFAGEGWSFTFEPEFERVKVSGGSDFNSTSLASILSYREGLNKLDFKLETAKDHDAAASTGGKVEVRYRRYFEKLAGIEPSLRVSLGETFNSGKSDFPFFTVQPKLAYELNDHWEPYVSLRYRNAFESGKNYQTETLYVGVAINVGRGWEIEPSVLRKFGDEESYGFKFEITKSFQ